MASASDVVVRPKARLVGLDLLRFVAIALVLGRHLDDCPAPWPPLARSFFATWRRGGWVGVDLFFVLSGFLVSGLLFTEYRTLGRISLVRFYTRRGWKIYPPFFAMILVSLVVNLAMHQPMSRRQVLSECLFLQSYVWGLWYHTWSLSVEEHFYILLPVFLLALAWAGGGSVRAFRAVPAVAVLLGAAILALRISTAQLYPTFDYMTHMFPTHLRLDALFYGVAISYLYHFHGARLVEPLRPWRRPLILVGALLLVPSFGLRIETHPIVYTVGFTLFSLASGMMLVGVLLCRPREGGPVAWLAAIGAYSYSIYLWHIPLKKWGGMAVTKGLGRAPGFGAETALYLAGSLALGVVMAKLIEIPSLRLRDRWFPARSRPPAVAAPRA